MWREKYLSLIDLRQLRYFLAAAEYGSFRKAANALAVQESSISRRVRYLEDQLSASLFRRHNGGVALTLAGRHFLHQVRTAMKHLGDGVIDVGSIRRSETGHLRVSLVSALGTGFLRDLFEAYTNEQTGVRIDFSENHSIDHVAAVKRHEVDITFVAGTERHAGCETTHLWSEQMFVVLPANHPLSDQRSLVWADLLNERFIVCEQAPGHEIHEFVVRRLSRLGHHPEIHRQNVGRDNLLSLVAIGRGLTFVSEAATSTRLPGLIYRPIRDEMLPFSSVWSPQNDNPAFRRLMSLAFARCPLASLKGFET